MQWLKTTLLVSFCAVSAVLAHDADLASSVPAVDFGTVRPFEQIEKTIKLINSGPEEVELCGVGSDCVCLSATLVAQIVPSGRSSDWSIRLETCDYLGEVRRSVWARTTAGGRVLVPVRYRVVPELFTSTPELATGVFPALVTSPVEGELHVQTIDTEVFELLGGECDDPRLEVLIEQPMVARDTPGVVRVRLQQPVDEGSFRPTVWVSTSSAEVPRIRVPVFGTATAGIASEQAALELGAVLIGTGGRAAFTLRHAADAKVLRAELDPPAIGSIQSIRRNEDGTTLVTVTDTDLPLGNIRGRLRIQYAEAGQRGEAVVPVRGFVTPEQ